MVAADSSTVEADRVRSPSSRSWVRSGKDQSSGARRRQIVASGLVHGARRRVRLRSQGRDELVRWLAPFWGSVAVFVRARGGRCCGAAFRWPGDALRRRGAANRRGGDAGGSWRHEWRRMALVLGWRRKMGRAYVIGPYCLDGLLFLVAFAFAVWLFSVVAFVGSGLWVLAGCCLFYCLVCCRWFVLRNMRAINPCIRCVGIVGLFACGCTHCALSALGWRRVPCFVKWSLPPSGRMRLHATGCRCQWQHDRKAGRTEITLCCIKVADRVIFPLCHHWEANRTVWGAFFASWCGLEYKYLVESSHELFSGCTLVADCNLGFRLNVPPLYSPVSFMKA